jgi:hypothetical protein
MTTMMTDSESPGVAVKLNLSLSAESIRKAQQLADARGCSVRQLLISLVEEEAAREDADENG